ncbi:hypothetical protein BSQ39_05695 [Loigolactobacillus backii]|uniref:non-canonical purine NTP pyrophosphatase n=1 Tax=Loigolactobacillus backii TaxID=375175 RepID=UPI000C1CA8EF|nr:non-canonical purine NTP pyrophosphatase [Loigolactobacillus backii]PIO83102.1 hypothetical protein BSQ39_05695 [Loigolactobacillus backii]
MKTIIFASHNRKKLAELSQLMPANVNLILPKTINFTAEGNVSYYANAKAKVMTLRNINLPILADDSGIEFKALPQSFGVRTRRDLAQIPATQWNDYLLKRLAGETNRQVCLRSVLVLWLPNALWLSAEGCVTGQLVNLARGHYSGGFDQLLELPGISKTLAELPAEKRRYYSHRGRAMVNLMQQLRQLNW